MSTTVEQLELEIKSSSQSAVNGIDALSSSLSKLKNSVKGGVGLTGVANQVNKLNSAVSSFDGNNAQKIDKLADSLNKLSSLGKLKISSSVANQLGKLGTAVSGLSGIDYSSVNSLANAITPLGQIAKAKGFDSTINSLKKLPTVVKELDDKTIELFTTKVEKLTTALAPLAQQLNTVSVAFSKLPTNMSKLANTTTKTTSSNGLLSGSYINLWAKAKMAYAAVSYGAKKIAGWMNSSNEYVEDLNLFTASLGQYAKEAQKYAEQVSELMGIDPAKFMKNQGVFMTITEGFGVASDRAYTMSQNLTQLGYDLSSFFNITVDEAMQKLNSGIAGELEPLRRLGYDLSQARLQAIALSLGIQKSYTEMTQAEKSQLRYYAIMTQVTVAQGDMARTLNAPANQMRIFRAQVEQAGRAIGNIFIPALNAILPYAIAVVKVIRLVANSIASLFGFKLPEVDYSGISAGANAIGDLANNAGDAGNGLGNAAKKAKQLKNALLGIDELNVISPNDDSGSGGSGGSGGGGGIGGSGLDFDLPTYDFLGDLVSTKIDKIVDSIKDKMWDILSYAGAIGLALATWKLGKFIKKLGWVDFTTKQLIGIALTVGGAFLYLSEWVNAFVNGLDWDNFFGMLVGAAGVVGGLYLAFGPVAAAAGAAATGIGLFALGIKDAIENGMNLINAVLIPLGATLGGAGIGVLIGSIGGPLGAAIGLCVGLVADGVIAIIQNWDTVKKYIDKFFNVTLPNIWEGFKSKVKNLPNDIRTFFHNLWQPIADYDWKGLGNRMGKWLGGSIRSAIDWVKQKVPEFFGGLWDAIKNFFAVTLPTMFAEMVVWFVQLPENIFNAVKDGFKWFVDIGKAIIDGIFEGLATIWKAIKDFVKGFVDGFKEALGIHSPSKVFMEIGVFLWEGLIKGLLSGIKGIGKWVKRNIIKPITNAIKNNPIADIVINIKNTATEWWNNAKEWWGEKSKKGLESDAFINLVKKGWSTVKGWIGNIPILDQGIRLVKKLWSTVKEWIGNIPTLDQGIQLVKHLWTTVKNWVGNIPILDQGIQLIKSAWSTVKNWIGNIPILDQGIQLVKHLWSTVKNWIGNIPTLSQAIQLVKSAWSSVKNWIGNIPVIGQGISLFKSAWSTIANWISRPVLGQGISLWKSGWSTIARYVGTGVSVGISLWKSGWSSISRFVGTSVSVGISLFKSGWSSIKRFFGLSGGGIVAAGGGVKLFESGGIITPNMWKTIPKYAGGTSRAHGSMFVAGENGAEMVGHVNGRTEVLNRFQMGQIMHESIVSGLGQLNNAFKILNNQMANCTNAIINSILVGANDLAMADGMSYDPTKSLAQYTYDDTQRAYSVGLNDNDSIARAMADFYNEYVEPVLSEIASDTKRQADKEEQTIVQVGGRTISETVEKQKKANGYSFTG